MACKGSARTVVGMRSELVILRPAGVCAEACLLDGTRVILGRICVPGAVLSTARVAASAAPSASTAAPPTTAMYGRSGTQRDVVVELAGRYKPEAVTCVGIPFGHARPQWIVPHGGVITVNG